MLWKDSGYSKEPTLTVTDRVVILCHDEGYIGREGVVIAVFPSGRVQVSVGPIAVLNLPPEGVRRVEPI